MSGDKFVLDGKKAVPSDLMTWARWYEQADRIVAKTEIAMVERVNSARV